MNRYREIRNMNYLKEKRRSFMMNSSDFRLVLFCSIVRKLLNNQRKQKYNESLSIMLNFTMLKKNDSKIDEVDEALMLLTR